MNDKRILLLLLLFVIKSAGLSINYSDSITHDSQLLLLDSIITSYQISGCCNSTIETCLKTKPVCSIAPRFFNFTCWLIMREDSYDKITRQLNKRHSSFFGPDTFTITPSNTSLTGDSTAPIIITAYINASCNLCKKVCIPLHMAVTDGPLKGMAQLQLKPATTYIGDRALMAAAKMGKFWDFFLSLEKVKKRLNEKFLLKNAEKLGLNRLMFEQLLYDEKCIADLKAMKNEALSNGVEISPTLFINSRRYRSYKDPQWVIDLVEYEAEKFYSSPKRKNMRK